MNTMAPTDIAAFVAAGALAATRLVSAAQPLWRKLPKWLAALAPTLVLSLPQIADAAGLVKTQTDLTTFVVTAVALLLPGLAAAEEAA